MASSQTPSVASGAPDPAPVHSRPPPLDTSMHSSRSQSYRPSRLSQPSKREYDSASLFGTPSEYRRTSVRADREYRADGESVVSMNAPSTVWDELNELKSRIQKIEIGGELPSSGGTLSNESAERPRTATTTITTMSSSPKVALKPGVGVVRSPPTANLHPLLSQSLERCKASLSPALYSMLETASTDAIELAALLSSNSSPSNMYSSSVASGGVTDRHLRRKADSVCRSLTDICITLSEGEPKPQGEPKSQEQQPQTAASARRRSQDLAAIISPAAIETPTSVRMFSRQQSLDPETPQERPGSSRALQRVEQRRVSMLGDSRSGNSSPRDNGPMSPLTVDPNRLAALPSPQVLSKVVRTSSSLRTRRQPEGEEDVEDDESSPRPISRATTDIGNANFRRRSSRLSGLLTAKPEINREYTSRHPLPAQATNSALPQPTPLRRIPTGAFAGGSPASPASPLVRDNSRRMLDREAEVQSSFGNMTPASDDERRKRRSLGLYSTTRSSLGMARRTSSAVRGPGVGDTAVV